MATRAGLAAKHRNRIGILAHQFVEMGEEQAGQLPANLVYSLINAVQVFSRRSMANQPYAFPQKGQLLELNQQLPVFVHDNLAGRVSAGLVCAGASGIFSFFPGKRRSVFKPLAERMALTLVPWFLAIFVSVSPRLTT